LFGCDEQRHADEDDDDPICEDCEDLLERIETAEGANKALANLLAENQEWAEDLRADNDRFAQQCREMSKTAEDWKDIAAERAATIKNKLHLIARMEDALERQHEENKGHRSLISQLQEENYDLDKERLAFKNRCEAIEGARKSWEKIAGERATKIADLEELNDKIAKSNHSLADELTETRGRLRHVEGLRDADRDQIARLETWLDAICEGWGDPSTGVYTKPQIVSAALAQYEAHKDASR
jgi:chromosome segregation ATPase